MISSHGVEVSLGTSRRFPGGECGDVAQHSIVMPIPETSAVRPSNRVGNSHRLPGWDSLTSYAHISGCHLFGATSGARTVAMTRPLLSRLLAAVPWGEGFYIPS